MLPAWIRWIYLVIRQGKRNRTGFWIRRGGFQVEKGYRHLFGVTCGQAFSGQVGAAVPGCWCGRKTAYFISALWPSVFRVLVQTED